MPLTQNTFIKAFINIRKLKDPNSFGAWLFTICNNEITLFYRKKQKNISENIDIIDLENISNESELEEMKNVNNKYSVLHNAINILDEK